MVHYCTGNEIKQIRISNRQAESGDRDRCGINLNDLIFEDADWLEHMKYFNKQIKLIFLLSFAIYIIYISVIVFLSFIF